MRNRTKQTRYCRLSLNKRPLSNGVRANQKLVRVFNTTPIIQAARFDHLDMVKLLVSKGDDIHHRNYNVYDAIIETSSKGHLDVVKHRLPNGADIHHQDNDR